MQYMTIDGLPGPRPGRAALLQGGAVVGCAHWTDQQLAELAGVWPVVGYDPSTHTATGGGELVEGGIAPNAEPIPLDSLRARAVAAIDAAAEQARLAWITGGAGQALVYQRKSDEARRYASVVAAEGTPEPSDYPVLAAEVGITAPDLAGVVAVVQGLDAAWAQVAAAIEALRLGAKAAVAAASDAAAIQAAPAITWPVPE